jgi:phosphate transport system protein
VDDLNRQIQRELTTFMLENPGTITRALNLMLVARSLERIADHAKNISEEVYYLYSARDIRHTHKG